MDDGKSTISLWNGLRKLLLSMMQKHNLKWDGSIKMASMSLRIWFRLYHGIEKPRNKVWRKHSII